MRLRFACEHCSQLLSVGTKKIGRRVTCPKCKTTITVPNEQDAAVTLAMHKSSRAEPEEEPFSQFAVFDDEIELVYEEDEPGDGADSPAEGVIDRRKVAVPRYVLYVQGALLGAVALGAFVFGLLVGRATAPPSVPAIDENRPCIITGRLLYRTAAAEPAIPDDGSVVIVVPERAQPDADERMTAEGFRPLGPPPEQGSAGVTLLNVLGGAYARADRQGRFSVQVPRSGNYFVLLISRNRRRADGAAVPREDSAQILRYFQSAEGLLASRQYHWSLRRVRGDTNLETFIFGEPN